MVSGIIGVPLGSYLSQLFIKRYPRCDPIICATGLIISAPFMAGAIILVSANTGLTYFCIFLAELSLNLNWAIVADILLVSSRSLSNFIFKGIFLFCADPEQPGHVQVKA